MLAEIVAEKVVHNVTPMWRIVEFENFKKQEVMSQDILCSTPYMVLSQDGETVTMKDPCKRWGFSLEENDVYRRALIRGI